MSSLPIIFIHFGNASYLWYAVRQARLFNPDAEIILLGDRSNAQCPFVTRHILIDHFFVGAQQFASVYQHLSTNKLQFELFCFQRWFVLREFMRRENIARCLFMDSDVMLYCHVDKEYEHFASHDMTLSNAETPGNVFVNRRSALDALCEFLTSMYTCQSKLAVLRQRFEKTGIISDMTALMDFSSEKIIDIGDTRKIIDGATWDDNVHCPSGFEIQDGIKKFTWDNDIPYARRESGELVQFNSIHLQGVAKKRIAKFASRFDFACLRTFVRSQSTERAGRYLQSIKKRLQPKAA